MFRAPRSLTRPMPHGSLQRKRMPETVPTGESAFPQSPGRESSGTASRRPEVPHAFHRRLAYAHIGERGLRPENMFPARLLIGHVTEEDTAYSDREQHQAQQCGDRCCEHLDVKENAFHCAHLLLTSS